MTQNQAKLWAQDWQWDLNGFPHEVVKAACDEWRRGTNKFKPTPGHILKICNRIVGPRRAALKKLTQIIETEERLQSGRAG